VLKQTLNVEMKSMKVLRAWKGSSIYETVLLNTMCVISGFCCEVDVNSAVLKTIYMFTLFSKEYVKWKWQKGFAINESPPTTLHSYSQNKFHHSQIL